jgi:hypothetical protein
MGVLTPQTFELLAGAAFLFVAVIGGGITAKEVTIPSVPIWGRCAAAVVGLALIGVGIFIPTLTAMPDQIHPCRNPKNLPNVANTSRTESDARNFLSLSGFFNVTTEPAFIVGAPKGVVASQSPAPGAILCPRDIVTIRITQ